MCVRVLTLGAKVEARMSVCPSELDKSEEDVVFGGYGYSGNNDELLEICLGTSVAATTMVVKAQDQFLVLD